MKQQNNQSSINVLNDIINNLVNSQVGQEAMNQFNEQMSELAQSFADSQTKQTNTKSEQTNPSESESCQPENDYLECDCNEQEVLYDLVISHQLAILNETPFCSLSRNDTQSLIELERLRRSIIDGGGR